MLDDTEFVEYDRIYGECVEAVKSYREQHGGSQRAPGRCRVVNVNPQFFDRDQTLFNKPGISHARLSTESPRKMPVAFPAYACKDGRALRCTLFHELSDTITWLLNYCG